MLFISRTRRPSHESIAAVKRAAGALADGLPAKRQKIDADVLQDTEAVLSRLAGYVSFYSALFSWFFMFFFWFSDAAEVLALSSV